MIMAAFRVRVPESASSRRPGNRSRSVPMAMRAPTRASGAPTR
uniref:Uncharacterized protein n=1 Tax=Nonomuraea gerenzanensis TaxID=93944 RepID=A0A1M4EIA9_9ACTN|nr:hypothetical protein BN4615_P8197 [Nonomuraea gerenzanensis]